MIVLLSTYKRGGAGSKYNVPLIKEVFWVMEFDNKTILIIGLIVGGIVSLYVKNTELASAIFGGLVGYLSHGITITSDDDERLLE